MASRTDEPGAAGEAPVTGPEGEARLDAGPDGEGRPDDGSWSDDADEVPSGPIGPLDADAARRVAAAEIAVIGTSDVHGRRDLAALVGPACFLRVLDATRLAYPDSGVEPVTAGRSNLAESPGVALLLVAPDGRGGRRGLHVNGTARVVGVAELRDEHPDLPSDPVPGSRTDVWVVVEVEDAYALDGDDVPPLSVAAAPAAAVATGRASGSRRNGLLVALLAVLVLIVGASAVGLATSGGPGDTTAAPPPGPAAGPPPAPAGPTGPPTLFGRVSEVRDPATVVVDVAGTPVTVGIVGLDAAAVPACAVPASLAFARATLQGQEVTLVPDPTIPQVPGTTRAYAVLGTQQSYTDAAISAGHAPYTGPARYERSYTAEQRDARDAGVGMWGRPCVR